MKKKYLYYRYKYKDKKIKRSVSKILVFTIIIFFLYFFSFNAIQMIKNFLKIEQVEIIKNNTTLPNSLILKIFLNNKISFFNFRKILKKLSYTYSEIEEIKTNFFPFKKLKLELKSRIPMFYTIENTEKIFISKKSDRFKIFDESRVDFSKIIEIKFKNSFDVNRIVSIYNFLLEKNLLSYIKMIEIKDNNEYILYFVNGSKIVFDDTFDKINLSLLFNTLIFALNKRIYVYARLLDEGMVYIK